MHFIIAYCFFNLNFLNENIYIFVFSYHLSIFLQLFIIIREDRFITLEKHVLKNVEERVNLNLIKTFIK